MIKKKVAGFSMVETIVAMVIIVSLLAVGLMLFLNVLNGDKAMNRIKAIDMCSYYAQAYKDKEVGDDEAINENGIDLIITVVPQDKPHLRMLYILAKDENGTLLAERKELIWED